MKFRKEEYQDQDGWLLQHCLKFDVDQISHVTFKILIKNIDYEFSYHISLRIHIKVGVIGLEETKAVPTMDSLLFTVLQRIQRSKNEIFAYYLILIK